MANNFMRATCYWPMVVCGIFILEEKEENIMEYLGIFIIVFVTIFLFVIAFIAIVKSL